ncbi:MAG: hypothetical protein QNJ12_00085 [Ilumatobacter sp.]|uniref:hypothetical protein n=1 Tax=Ilumatobacter sp. TaxID=1967498 RepID=UPI00262B3E9C|nr:hypothetical protein [Ilumatobacter sp.]MDJ0767148.1 hypothetical protein [Ilumatobacter sp.]
MSATVVKRLILVTTAVVGALGATATPSSADEIDSDRPPPPEPPPTVVATVSNFEQETDEPPPDAPPPPCSWYYPASSEEEADIHNRVTEIVNETLQVVFFESRRITVTYYYAEGVLNRWNESDGEFEWRIKADCHGDKSRYGVADGEIDYTSTAPPDPSILLRRTTVAVTEEIDVPPPAINPAGAAAINLGLWLGVEPIPPVVAEATLGPLWARTTATLASTSFDLGNGETVTCAGNGTPIPESQLDTLDAGPCGYTYTTTDDLDVTEIGVTVTWHVTWELSNGRTGREPDIVVTTTIPYEVYEIQTVGTG